MGLAVRSGRSLRRSPSDASGEAGHTSRRHDDDSKTGSGELIAELNSWLRARDPMRIMKQQIRLKTLEDLERQVPA
jgi:hypothetical protein